METQTVFVTEDVVHTRQYVGLVHHQMVVYAHKVEELELLFAHHHQVCIVALELMDIVQQTEVQTVDWFVINVVEDGYLAAMAAI